MLRRVVEAANNLNTYAQIALVLFVLAFVLMLLRERMRSKGEIEYVANLPLEDATERSQAGGQESL